jgi:hypothetical protein
MQDDFIEYDRADASISLLSDFSVVNAMPYIRAIGIITTVLCVWAVLSSI